MTEMVRETNVQTDRQTDKERDGRAALKREQIKRQTELIVPHVVQFIWICDSLTCDIDDNKTIMEMPQMSNAKWTTDRPLLASTVSLTICYFECLSVCWVGGRPGMGCWQCHKLNLISDKRG